MTEVNRDMGMEGLTPPLHHVLRRRFYNGQAQGGISEHASRLDYLFDHGKEDLGVRREVLSGCVKKMQIFPVGSFEWCFAASLARAVIAISEMRGVDTTEEAYIFTAKAQLARLEEDEEDTGPDFEGKERILALRERWMAWDRRDEKYWNDIFRACQGICINEPVGPLTRAASRLAKEMLRAIDIEISLKREFWRAYVEEIRARHEREESKEV
jgi:hypothetical protein